MLISGQTEIFTHRVTKVPVFNKLEGLELTPIRFIGNVRVTLNIWVVTGIWDSKAKRPW